MKKAIALLMAIITTALLFAACGNKEEAPVKSGFEWETLVLGGLLPNPNAEDGDIYCNDNEELNVAIEDYSVQDYQQYIAKCEENGFTVDKYQDGDELRVFNSEGYMLVLDYDADGQELEIELYVPLKMMEFGWPSAGLATKIPSTESNYGLIDTDDEDCFAAYIGKTDKAAYMAYVESCMEHGFNVDYLKSETEFSAYNEEKYYIEIEYFGFDTITIYVEVPEEEALQETKPVEATETQATTPPETEATTEATEVTTEATEAPTTQPARTGLRSDFKNAMDSYEEFMDDYVAFMKKYIKNPYDMTVLADYAKFMADYAKFCKDFEKWESEDLNDEELAYYLEVQSRVSQKLLEVAQ